MNDKLNNRILLSIIICTYNRAELLDRCLLKTEKLVSQYSNVEVIVIDNKSNDNTKEIFLKYLSRNNSWGYTFEAQQGLSYARNKGALTAKGQWLFYVDDDGIISDNSITEIFDTIDNYPFKLFTGIVTALEDYNTPKWFPYEWGNTIVKGEMKIRPIENDSLCGGIMVLEKRTLLKLGLFNTALGMSGKETAYGEELQLEQLARKKNIPIGFNPHLILKHSIAEIKKSVKWILIANYKSGKATAHVHNKTLKDLPSTFLSFIERIIKNFIRSGINILSKKDYYWQNYVIDNAGPLLSYIGLISTIVKKSMTTSNINDNLN